MAVNPSLYLCFPRSLTSGANLETKYKLKFEVASTMDHSPIRQTFGKFGMNSENSLAQLERAS